MSGAALHDRQQAYVAQTPNSRLLLPVMAYSVPGGPLTPRFRRLRMRLANLRQVADCQPAPNCSAGEAGEPPNIASTIAETEPHPWSWCLT